MLSCSFFNRDPQKVAKALLGKVLRHFYQDIWLNILIIETEAYYLDDKASHASLGYTEKRKALFMPAGTIYMYYARGGDSMNISCKGQGNAVLIKSAIPCENPNDQETNQKMLLIMQTLNPLKNISYNYDCLTKKRPVSRLCSGQTLLCKSLHLKVPDWNQKCFDKKTLRIDDIGYRPKNIIQTSRLGIPSGRDERLLYRFISEEHVKFCTKIPKIFKIIK